MTTAPQKFRSMADMFRHRVAATPQSIAFHFPKGENGWGSITWEQTGKRVRAIACGLRSLGLENEQRCAILSSTRYEWILADLGILCSGGATTTVYPSNTPEECRFILADSDSRFVFAEDAEQVKKLQEKRSELPNVAKVITFDEQAADGAWVISLEELETLGNAYEAQNPGIFETVSDSVEPHHLATLIYTSGTTGQPKGVELTHDCWLFEGEAAAALNILSPDDLQYLWLPLSHSFGKVLQAMQLHIGFPTAVDGRIPKLVDNLAVVRPTFMAAAPRIFEKVYNKIITGAAQEGGLKYKILTWSIEVGREASALRQRGQEPGGILALKYAVADKLVFSKLRARFGGRLRFFISGSAPLSRDMAEFFHAANILILEGYGLTESSAASCVNTPQAYRFGSVGKPLPGVKVKIAEDGEVLLAGRGIMRGYHNLPEATAECLEDGWLHTGDIGELDTDGMLRITDRKKDLIKTSGGKYVAPQKLESRLKALAPYVSQVLVHGNGRNFCSALVTLDEENIGNWAAEHGLSGASTAEIAKSSAANAMVQEAVDNLNKELPSFETIKRFAILPKDFTVEDGELTPSMKVKRKAVEQKYKDVLDGFYSGSMAKL